MGLDTKYRPLNYEDVLGQEAIIRVVRGLVAKGRGRWQSYLFAGTYGSGKTTLGRILVRALLCDNPVDGSPCNKCLSCTSILEYGSSDAFIEIDAATNSGKADIKGLLEDLEHATFSGRPRIYLFDEAHQLSKNALDALLKPLEEEATGSQNKRLVCVFCTTEPEAMRKTILSRCAPAFVIQPLDPSAIAARLQYVCESEGITATTEALMLIAESTECHVRDAFKAIEGVSAIGDVDGANVSSYLNLDVATTYLEVLENIGVDQAAAIEAAETTLSRSSPLVCYDKLADLSLLVYKVHLGVAKVPVYLDEERVRALGERRGFEMLRFAEKFADRPGRPSPSTLLCDIALLHHGGGLPSLTPGVVLAPVGATPAPQQPAAQPQTTSSSSSSGPTPPTVGRVPFADTNIGVGANKVRVFGGAVKQLQAPKASGSVGMAAEDFCTVLRHSIREMNTAGGGGPTR